MSMEQVVKWASEKRLSIFSSVVTGSKEKNVECGGRGGMLIGRR